MVDIHLHDTYFVTSISFVYWLLAGFALFTWFIYLLSNKLLYSKWLSWAHIIICLLTIALLLVLLYSGIDNRPRCYYEFSAWDISNEFGKGPGILVFILVGLLAGQITYIINLIAGLFKTKV